MSCLPTDKDWKQDFYNNTDCDIYMLINQHQENGVIYPYYGELPLSIDHVDCNLQSRDRKSTRLNSSHAR